MNARHLDRRQFLSASAATMVAAAATPVWAANDKIKLAFIGVGGRGGGNLRTLEKTGQIDVVAICDVNANHLGKAGELAPGAKRFADFRELYEQVGDRVDAVVVSTCEHTHAYATMPALKLGKHVYCEKPLTYNVAEARKITEAAAANPRLVTQMGTQIHAGANYRRVVELVQSGAIGDVREVHVWVSRAWGLQSEQEAKQNGDIFFVAERPTESQTPPPELDWDLWLGPAPYRPFHESYFPGPRWYRWWDFGNGTMSDLGSHWIDLPFWALKLDAPVAVEAFGPSPHPEIAPASMHVKYEYAARGPLPACDLYWYQGSHKPKIWQEKSIPQWANGVLFVGSKGMILADYRQHTLLPEDKFTDFTPPPQTIPPSPGHHEQWLQCCRSGEPTDSPFSYAGPLTEANHLGNVAFRVGKRIRWNAKEMRAEGCPEAEPFLTREPRKGWSL
ncbi:MAG: Gfo/Idh/MocA family oxidoreductase [Planctomycetales bacterium]|nr:Gfo/Idh/MocA family oxidoreductase [Planctomycetales bacterium]